MIRQLLSRWADETLQREVAKLESELDATKRELAVTESERDNLAAVIARDRERIRSEGAAYARQRAEAEGNTNEQRSSESIRRFVS